MADELTGDFAVFTLEDPSDDEMDIQFKLKSN